MSPSKLRIPLLALCGLAIANLAHADGPWTATAALASRLPPEATLGSVLFDTDSAHIDQALWPMLRTAAALVRSHHDTVIVLDGYADVRGSRNHNLTLSAKRVKAVAAFLVREGVDPTRISTNVHGETRASANIRDRAGQVFDRRVSIAVTARGEPA